MSLLRFLLACLTLTGLLLLSCQPDRHVLTNDFSLQPVETGWLLDSTLDFQGVRHAAYGYSYQVPSTFHERSDPDTIAQVDRALYLGPEPGITLKFFVEGMEQHNLTSDSLQTYYQQIRQGNHPFTRGCQRIVFEHYEPRSTASKQFDPRFLIVGQRGNQEFVWQSELSEWPITGTRIYKSMLLRYPISHRQYYRPVGLHMAEAFGHMRHLL